MTIYKEKKHPGTMLNCSLKSNVEEQMWCKDFSLVGNKTPKTHHEIFIRTMADLLLDKDVLVLISSVADERIELAQAISLKTCEKTKGTNIRMVNCFHDLRDLEKEQRAIVYPRYF